jgi:hypothetical protein
MALQDRIQAFLAQQADETVSLADSTAALAGLMGDATG